MIYTQMETGCVERPQCDSECTFARVSLLSVYNTRDIDSKEQGNDYQAVH